MALLAAVESLLSAVVADSMTGDRHNSNAELMAQGVANLVAPLVGGIPVTGAIARTATNFRSGARSPSPAWSTPRRCWRSCCCWRRSPRYVPLATLAAVLFVVAYNMGEWREIGSIWRLDWADKSVWIITFALTVMADLTVAVEVGMALAALLYIYRVTDTTSVSTVTPEYIEDGRAHVLQDKHVPPYVTILRIHGPFLFGMTDKLADATADLSAFAPIVILRLRNMTGHRRDRPARARSAERSAEEVRPHADPVRRAAPARRVPPSGRVHRSRRRRQHRAARAGGARAGAGDPIAASRASARKPRGIWRRRPCSMTRASMPGLPMTEGSG